MSPASRRGAVVCMISFMLLGSLSLMLQSEHAVTTATTIHTATISTIREKANTVEDDQSRDSEFQAVSIASKPVDPVTPIPSRPRFRRFRRDYECLGWRATNDCSPDGARDPTRDVGCDITITGGQSGFCLYRHKQSNSTIRLLTMHCNSIPSHVAFDCANAAELVDYDRKTLDYSHDRSFDFTQIQKHVIVKNNLIDFNSVSFVRGIAIVVFEDVLASAYASIRWLRELGGTLPIEVWFTPVELARDHPLLVELVTNYGVFLRELDDPFATGYYTKLYAVYYSAFDQVLLLDADNFAVKDPAYLFDTMEFTSTGAVFWPDFWHPDNTIFNIHNQSLLWQVLDLPFIDMFEQESGQVLIDRRRHMKAMNVLMYFGFSLPRVLEMLVWGDKDLFRLAWLKTNSTFHMITTPPGSGGTLQHTTNQFCGVTMVQHDTRGDILFLHRNAYKLRLTTLNPRVWTHIFQFKPGTPRAKYVIQSAKLFSDIGTCYGRQEPVDALEDFMVTRIEELSFRHIESRLVQFINDAGDLVYHRRKQ